MKLPFERSLLPRLPRTLFSIAAFALCSAQALAIDPFVIKDIRVEGIQRTEPGTVFSYLPVRVGETLTDEKAAAAIKALYATGFFKDVRIEAEGDVMVVQVEERPAIAGVDFTGIKEFDKEQLTAALKELGLGVSRVFDKALLDRAEQELKRQYLSRGLYGVNVTTTVTPVERNRVMINFNVDEGEVSRIKQINIVGNKAFTDKQLLDLMRLSTPGWFTWYSKADQYSKQKLSGDIEALRSFYVDRGYLEMQVESTQVSISPDRKDIFVTVNINEGNKFTVSDVKLEGEMFGREQEFRSLLSLKPGDVYSGQKMAESIKRIAERMGNFGYAFANVNANPEINRDKNEVAFTVFIDPGKRVYVRNINIAGNTKTRDEVIRRELRQLERSWYDGEKIRLSRNRVDRLGYFTEVNIDTPEVPGTTDQVDLNLTVVEKPTGNITLGAGFSSEEKLILSGSFNQDNAFGSGNSIGVDINTSRRYRTFSFKHTNPYFTDDGISRSTEVYLRTQRPPSVSRGDWEIENRGAHVRFGVPFTETDRVFFGIGVERTQVTTDASSPLLYRRYVEDFTDAPNGVGTANVTTFPLTAAWARDSRDSALVPTTGRLQRANLTLGLGSDTRYYIASYQHQYFKPIFSSSTLALNGQLDYGRSIGDTPYPVFKNFFAGGIGTVRGYEGSSLAVTPLGNQDPVGGQSRLILNAELQFPFPGSGSDRSLRWFTFVDGGNVFRRDESIQIKDLRYAAGIGINWISPIGPLKLSFGKPLNAKEGDKKETFQFQLGTGF